MDIKTIQTIETKFLLMEKQQKQELDLHNHSAFHHCEYKLRTYVCVTCTHAVYSGMQEWVVQENGATGLVVLESTEMLGLIICFAIHFLWVHEY